MGCCRSRSRCPKVFPEAKGPYSVGCADIMTNTTDEDKGLFMRLFYPTEKINLQDHISELTPAMAQPSHKYASGMVSSFNLPCACIFKRLARKALDQGYLTSAVWHAPVATDGGPFRVMVISSGLGGFRTLHSVLATNLASNGFIVAVLEQRSGDAAWTYTLTAEGKMKEMWGYKSGPLISMNDLKNIDQYAQNEDKIAPWYKLVEYRIEECLKTLELLREMSEGTGCFDSESNKEGKCIVFGKEFDWSQFLGKITVEGAALAGHSLGGSTSVAAMVCPEFTYFVHLDPQSYFVDDEYYMRMSEIPPARALFFIQDDQTSRAEQGKLDLILKAAKRARSGKRAVIRILKSNHVQFCDAPHLKSNCMCNKMFKNAIRVEIFQQILDDMILALINDDNETMDELIEKYQKHIEVIEPEKASS